MPKIITRKTLDDIEACLRVGMNLDEIQCQTGISKPTIAKVRTERNLDDVWKSAVKKRQEQRKQGLPCVVLATTRKEGTLEDRIQAGDVLADIAKDHNMTLGAVRSYMIQAGLYNVWKMAKTTPESRIARLERKYPGIAVHIKNGTGDNELATIYNVTRQAVNDALLRHGFRDMRRAAQEDNKEVQQQYKTTQRIEMISLLTCLRDINYEKCEGDQTLIEFVQYCVKSRSRLAIPQIFNVFELYRKAGSSNKKVNVSAISREVGLPHATVAYFIDQIPSFGGRPRIRSKLTADERHILNRAARSSTALTYPDMGAILGVPPYILSDYARHQNIPRLPQSPLLRRDREWVSYTQAMDYFEGIAVGFTKQEAMIYSNIKSHNLVEAIERSKTHIESEVQRFQEEVGVFKYNLTIPNTQEVYSK